MTKHTESYDCNFSSRIFAVFSNPTPNFSTTSPSLTFIQFAYPTQFLECTFFPLPKHTTFWLYKRSYQLAHISPPTVTHLQALPTTSPAQSPHHHQHHQAPSCTPPCPTLPTNPARPSTPSQPGPTSPATPPCLPPSQESHTKTQLPPPWGALSPGPHLERSEEPPGLQDCLEAWSSGPAKVYVWVCI